MRKLFMCLVAAAMFVGCDKGGAPGDVTSQPPSPVEPGISAEAPGEPELAIVEVPAEGKEFTPPIKPEQVPAGAWYCDMGTVEYARMDKGDGKCPVCGMLLKQKGGGPAEPTKVAQPAEGAEGHEGHGH